MPGSIRRTVKKRCKTDPEYKKLFEKARAKAGGKLTNMRIQKGLDKNGKVIFLFPDIIDDIEEDNDKIINNTKEEKIEIDVEEEIEETIQEIEPELIEEDKKDYKICRVCYEKFEPKTWNQVYCSDECRNNK